VSHSSNKHKEKKLKRKVDGKNVIFRIKVMQYITTGRTPDIKWGVEVTRNGKRIDSDTKGRSSSVAYDGADVWEQSIKNGEHDQER
jgi:hypothetical protein